MVWKALAYLYRQLYQSKMKIQIGNGKVLTIPEPSIVHLVEVNRDRAHQTKTGAKARGRMVARTEMMETISARARVDHRKNHRMFPDVASATKSELLKTRLIHVVLKLMIPFALILYAQAAKMSMLNKSIKTLRAC